MTLCDPGIAVILANAGYNWLFVDTEHNPITDDQLQSILYALSSKDMAAMVRVRSNDPALIKYPLDKRAQNYTRKVKEGALLCTVGSDNRFVKEGALQRLTSCLEVLKRNDLRS